MSEHKSGEVVSINTLNIDERERDNLREALILMKVPPVEATRNIFLPGVFITARFILTEANIADLDLPTCKLWIKEHGDLDVIISISPSKERLASEGWKSGQDVPIDDPVQVVTAIPLNRDAAVTAFETSAKALKLMDQLFSIKMLHEGKWTREDMLNKIEKLMGPDVDLFGDSTPDWL